MLAKITEIENLIDTSQQMCARHVTIEVERVEKLVLPGTQLTHHDDALRSIDVFQDTYESAYQATFSTQSRYNGRSPSSVGGQVLGQWPPLAQLQVWVPAKVRYRET
jgi:hypothetical protein